MQSATARPVRAAPAAAKRPRGRPRKTVDERDDGNRRRALILGAARLFRRKGFDATSTRDIAAAAGMQSGSPFYHFKSKQAPAVRRDGEGMRSRMERQRRARERPGRPAGAAAPAGAQPLRGAAGRRQRLHPGHAVRGALDHAAPARALAALQSEYEARWEPVLQALHARAAARRT
jgi:AcrR family transcriptional regulator